MRILLFGASGLLGTELQKLNHELICPPHYDVNINKLAEIYDCISNTHPDIIINSAAVIDNRTMEKDTPLAIQTNIIGAANVAIACQIHELRLVYISTDYVYADGSHGNYKESDPLLPFNFYAWTKLAGEASARGVKNHLIIRTSFGSSKFSYSQAFTDKWSSKEYVDLIAPMIYEASVSPITGVLNVGTERKSLFDYAKRRNEKVKPVRLSETSFFTPYDTSLNLQKWLDYKSEKPVAKPHTKCRVCASDDLVKYLDLGLMPLANNLEITSLRARAMDRHPLQIMFCKSCGLSQLSVVIDPEKMYSYYTYRSGVNAPYAQHCRTMAIDLHKKFTFYNNSLVIDIAGNDGTLLKEFKKQLGCNVLNIDPASNLTAISEAQGIPTINDFWNGATALEAELKYGKADLITATNVFAHVDDIVKFLICCNGILKDEGVLVIECPYLVDFIDNMEFDTTYFEHLSYMSIIPMNKACLSVGLKIISVEKQNIHGGTIRVTIAKESSKHEIEDSVIQFMINEDKAGFNTIDPYKKWNNDVKATIKDFSSKVLELKIAGHKIACFAASAKGNTLLNSCGFNTDVIDYIVDQTPEKIGKFSPGTGIPIVNISELKRNPPDYIIILSWNFSEVIIPKIRQHCEAKIIIPIPEFVVL